MPAGSLIVAVDRIEGGTAVLEAEDGRHFEIPAQALAPRPREGMIYRVPLDQAGKPLWEKAKADREEEKRRKADMARRMGALKRKDGGGDVEL